MRYPLQGVVFAEGSGVEGAICYLTDTVELNDIHIKMIIEARNMTEEWALDKDSKWYWDMGKSKWMKRK